MAKYTANYKAKIRVDGIEKITKQTYEFSSETYPSENAVINAIKKYIAFLNSATGENTYQFIELVNIQNVR